MAETTSRRAEETIIEINFTRDESLQSYDEALKVRWNIRPGMPELKRLLGRPSDWLDELVEFSNKIYGPNQYHIKMYELQREGSTWTA